LVSGAIGKKRHLDRKELISVCAILILFFILFNLLNFSQKRWTLHPDDHDIYIFSKVLVETGHLWYTSPWNEEFKTCAFQPPIDNYISNKESKYLITSEYSPGIYFAVGLGHILGLRGPFVLVSFFSLLGMFFLFLLIRDIFGKETAFLSCLLLGLSAPYIYWSNMLFSNIPALSFTIGGLYFLNRALKDNSTHINYIASAIFFSIGIWIRYDYAFLVVILAFFSLLSRLKNLNFKKVISWIATFAVMATTFLLINTLAGGTPSGIRGAIGAGKQSAKSVARHFLNPPDISALFTNTRMYLFGMAPVLVTLGVFGAILALKRKRDYPSFAFLLAGIFSLYSYGKSAGFYAYGKNWLTSSYTRYFLPLFLALSIFAGYFLIEAVRVLPWKRIMIFLISLLVVAHLSISFFILYKNPYGLDFTDKYSGNRKNVDAFAKTLPSSSVIVDCSNDDYFRFDIISRAVLNPSYFPKKEAYRRLAYIIRKLKSYGVSVFMINNPERSMIKIGKFEKEYPYIKLKRLKHPCQFQYGSRTPDFYSVEIAR